MRYLLAVAGSLLLCACGHDTRTPVSLGTLVVPNQAPWLILEPGPEDVELRGLDEKLKLLPNPPVATALEAQLRVGVQQEYFTNLTIACNDLKADMRTNQDDAPNDVKLSLSLHCSINASGFISTHDYSVAPTTAVRVGSSDAAYARAFAILLEKGGKQMATQLALDVRTSRPSVSP